MWAFGLVGRGVEGDEGMMGEGRGKKKEGEDGRDNKGVKREGERRWRNENCPHR